MCVFARISIGSIRLRLRLVTSRGPPYPSRSPRARPSGWTRTQGLSRRDSHAPPLFGTPPIRMWNWPLAPLLQRAGNQVVREMPSNTGPLTMIEGMPSTHIFDWGARAPTRKRRPLTITRWNGANGFNGCPRVQRRPQESHGRSADSAGASMLQTPTRTGCLLVSYCANPG